MQRYHGPREYLEAAESPTTPVDELMRLAKSEYPFVRLAVARNPRTPPTVFAGLVSKSLEDHGAQQIAEAIASRTDTPPKVLERIAEAVGSHLNQGRRNGVAFAAGVALCSNPNTPMAAIEHILSPDVSKPQFRKVVARESRRFTVLSILGADVSKVVAARAAATLSSLEEGASDA